MCTGRRRRCKLPGVGVYNNWISRRLIDLRAIVVLLRLGAEYVHSCHIRSHSRFCGDYFPAAGPSRLDPRLARPNGSRKCVFCLLSTRFPVVEILWKVSQSVLISLNQFSTSFPVAGRFVEILWKSCGKLIKTD
jgi:hypothetical protein